MKVNTDTYFYFHNPSLRYNPRMLFMLLVSTQQTPLSTRGLIKAHKHKAEEEEESCFLPEQINFISMNPCSQCFLLAHLNRQEANFNWSPPHSAAVHVATGWEETEREGGRWGRTAR